MYKGVLEMIVESLAKERLDYIAYLSDEYVKADNEAKENLGRLQNTLSKEQADRLEEYLEAERYQEVIYTEISYKQGMKDLADIMLSLLIDT